MLTRSNVAQDNPPSHLRPIAPVKNCTAIITVRTATTPTRAVSSAQKSCYQIMFQKSMQTERPYGTPLKKWRKERKRSLLTVLILPSRMNSLRKKTLPLPDNSSPSILSAVAHGVAERFLYKSRRPCWCSRCPHRNTRCAVFHRSDRPQMRWRIVLRCV